MPVRVPDPTVDSQRIYRKFRYGDLLDLYMLDTRLQARSEQSIVSAGDSGRTLLGEQQFDWLVTGMDTSTARWQVIGQQVAMAPLRALRWPTNVYINSDQWDGYRYERQRLYDSIDAMSINNMVVLTGDIHTSWANDLPLSGYNASTGANSAGVEFVATSFFSEFSL